MRRRKDNDEHDDGSIDVLKDGQSIRVPLYMMDSVQKAVAERSTTSRMTFHDVRGRQVGHRPGFVFANDVAATDAKRAAYEQHDHEMSTAWMRHNTDATGEFVRGQQVGDQCTINGAAGHLRRVEGELVCVADKGASDSVMTDREEAYAQHEDWLTNAWQHR